MLQKMIPPTIGRVVLVYRGEKHVGSQWNTAQICYVHDEETINVAGFTKDGESFVLQGIRLRQDDIAQDPIDLPAREKLGENAFACWMPYQRGMR